MNPKIHGINNPMVEIGRAKVSENRDIKGKRVRNSRLSSNKSSDIHFSLGSSFSFSFFNSTSNLRVIRHQFRSFDK